MYTKKISRQVNQCTIKPPTDEAFGSTFDVLRDTHERLWAGTAAGLRIIEADGDLRVVAEAADGEAAIAAVRQHRPAVVAMDVEMPILGGIEATRRIMALPDPPAIIMVSQHTQDDSPAALAALAAVLAGRQAMRHDAVLAVREDW
jgi:DNA-binding NarL/FixJ family response regulator